MKSSRSISSKLSFLLSLTILVWWIGLFGTELYLLPASFVTLYWIYLARKQRLAMALFQLEALVRFQTRRLRLPWVLTGFSVLGGIWVLIYFLRYYSFNLWTLDAGLHSNIIFNLSQGEAYSSFFNIHPFADHFTPSLYLVALFYKIIPSIHWMTLGKTLSYTGAGLLLVWMSWRGSYGFRCSRVAAIWIGLLWFLFYKPIINSVRYEFHVSSYAPLLIVISFMFLEKRRWLGFTLCTLFLLGLKEHLGAVLIGFGLREVLHEERRWKVGILLIIIGAFSIYWSLYRIMPAYREGLESWSGVERIAPFFDTPGKIFYLFRLLLPLFFLPIIDWKNGIIAGPAIGINVISNFSKMYSSHYHYDDVAATLLVLAMGLSTRKLPLKHWWQTVRGHQLGMLGMLLFLLFFMSYWPKSSLRYLMEAIPSQTDWVVNQELERFDKLSIGKKIAVQDVLGPHFHRREIIAIEHRNGSSCVDQSFYYKQPKVFVPDYYVLSPYVSQYKIENGKECLEEFLGRSDLKRLEIFQKLYVFERVPTITTSSK